jgi:hypothetical protein
MAKPKANAPKFPTVTMVDSRTLTRADGTCPYRKLKTADRDCESVDTRC